MAGRLATGLVAAVVVLPGPAMAEARPFLGLETGYKRGDFGTAEVSALYSLTLNGGLMAADWHAGFALPYHRLDTEGTEAASGPGDLYLHAGRRLVPETGGGLSVYGTAAVKLPTADEDDGLGTGESDAGLFMSVRQRWGSWHLSAFGGFTLIGDPPATDYRNVTSYGLQATRLLTSAAVHIGLEGRTALTDDGEDPRELFAGGFRLLPGGRAATADAFLGLSDGSPSFGVRLGVVQWF